MKSQRPGRLRCWQRKSIVCAFFFTTREAFKEKHVPEEVYDEFDPSTIYKIPEGGYGKLGITGAKEILSTIDVRSYTHIISAVGTGTTLAGIIEAAQPYQKVIGTPVLKNAFSLQQEIKSLLPPNKHRSVQLNFDYHFGGYAKHTMHLIAFMNDFFNKTGIPTDFVYTAKTFYAAIDLFEKKNFTGSDKILVLHTGGLQGNLSLKKGTLIFG